MAKLRGAHAALSAKAETAQSSEAALQGALDRERQQAQTLARDLAAARGQIETRAEVALASEAKANAPEDGLDRERKSAELLSGVPNRSPGEDAQLASRQLHVPALTRAGGPTPPATPSVSPNEQKLLARADLFLKNRDIVTARLLLQRAVNEGSSTAVFMLAETFDPVQLSAWQALGVAGDQGKAQSLYARAYAEGIARAKERILKAQ